MDFEKIMNGFREAQIKGGSGAGLNYLNGVNDALEQQLSTNVTLFTLPEPESKAANAIGEVEGHNHD
jgi:hypothetical protein